MARGGPRARSRAGVMTAVAEEIDLYRSSFERLERGRGPMDPPWLARLRGEAIERFAALGFPTTKIEEWRFTSVAPILRTPFRRADEADSAAVTADSLGPVGFEGAFEGRRVVLVNGRYSASLSSLQSADGVRVASLREALAREPERLEGRLARCANDDRNAFTALNTAFIDDGVVLELAPGAIVEGAIQLLFLSTSGPSGPVVSHPRALVVAGRGSQAAIVETHAGQEGETYFSNAVTEVLLEDGAVLDHYKLQRESAAAFHVATLAVRQGRSTRFTDLSLCLGGSLVRNDVSVLFADEGGECALLGLFMADGEQHMDTHTLIDHARPHCSSREVYKGILDGRSRGVFHGTILVRKGAQKTDAHQVNKNLLLSGEALVNSTPALKILADDVKCKHGSTTGQIDANALFYLRSRGIAEREARSLLTSAFAGEIVGRIQVPVLRAGLEAFLRKRLPGAPEEAVA